MANPYEIQPAVAPQAASIAPPVTEQRSLPSATPVIIDAGTLVPVHLPQREEQAPSHKEQSPDIQPAARKPSTQSLSKTETSQSAGQLTPVDNGQTNDKIESQPAPTTASKKIPKVTKASEAGAKSSSARARGNGQASPKELQPSARERREGFALPQPAIPLEGRLLRKLFGF